MFTVADRSLHGGRQVETLCDKHYKTARAGEWHFVIVRTAAIPLFGTSWKLLIEFGGDHYKLQQWHYRSSVLPTATHRPEGVDGVILPPPP